MLRIRPGAIVTRWTAIALWGVALSPSATIAAELLAAWDFQSPGSDWKPVAKAVTIERVDTPGPEGKTLKVLRIRGPMEKHWNYAYAAPVTVGEGKIVRLSAWLRVDRLGPNSPMPYLKCEFQSADRKRSPGQAATTRYDGTKLGTWQQLTGEFRAPAGAKACWLALEKGTSGPAEIDACLANVRLETLPRWSFFDTYRLRPMPPRLAAARGVHPRLYLTQERIAGLRVAIKTTHAAVWKRVQQLADGAVRRGPRPYILDDGFSGREQLWQRGVGNTLPVLAMAYVLTDERKYLDAARAWAIAACDYPTWGLGRLDGMDLATGHQLFGLALVYDWCYRDLGDDTRRRIRETLLKRASAMFEAAGAGQASWHRSYLQNHLWVNITGMSAAGFALFDEVNDADCWIGLTLDKYRHTMAALGPDGASHEGVGYWEYGVEYMLKFMDLARTYLDVDLYGGSWWQNTAAYGQYLVLPRHAWRRDNCLVDIADCPRGNWYGPDYLLRHLADRFRDGHAQWLGREIDAAGVGTNEASWLNLVWLDPTLPAKPPADLPTLRHFDDMGIVAARSDWSGDESLVAFKCGPYIGRQAVQTFDYDPGGGHVHPDANHLVLFAQGEWLLRDDGYHPKWTGQHNTLLINGRGQLGEGGEWFHGREPLAVKALPRVVRAVSSPALDQITGDATEAYPKDLGLKRFVRHVLFLKPDVLIVADDIALAATGKLELRFHPESPAQPEGRAWLSRGKQSVLRLEPLTPEGVSVSAESLPLPGRHGRAGTDMFTLRLATQRATWSNLVALSWSAIGEQPPRVSAVRDGQRWTFQANGRRLMFDGPAGRAELVH
jgi:hypothetical protein